MRESPTSLSSPIICSFNRSLFHKNGYVLEIEARNLLAVLTAAENTPIVTSAQLGRPMSAFVAATQWKELRSRWWANNDFLNRFV